MRAARSAVALFLVLGTLAGPGSGALRAGPREYYVNSHSGADDSPGTKDRPLRSLDSVARLTLQPGDTVLFERGCRFEGGFQVTQSGTANSPITFKACGKGPAPRFTNPDSSRLGYGDVRTGASLHAVAANIWRRPRWREACKIDLSDRQPGRSINLLFSKCNSINYKELQLCALWRWIWPHAMGTAAHG
jgi:hypothetical protein